MRKYILTILVFCVALANTNAQQQCIITSPAAASSWTVGNTMPIQWNAGAFTSNVNISLIDYSINSPSGQVVVTIATNVSNTGSFSFLIPTSLPAKCTYGVYVENVIKTNWCYGPGDICIKQAGTDAICCPDFTIEGINGMGRECCMRCDAVQDSLTHNPNGAAFPAQGNGCKGYPIVACKNSYGQFIVYPNLPGFSYTWTITGGTPANITGNPVTILWGNGTTGSITVVITGPGGCKKTVTRNVCLLDKPIAGFAYAPNTNICRGTLITFNSSTSLGATSYTWFFGDGNTSTNVNPQHQYAAAGTYIVTLVVSSAGGGGAQPGGIGGCGCTDTLKQTIVVGKGPGIETCNKMLCPGDYAEYCSTDNCGTYAWTITGGTIIGPANQKCVKVQWTTPPGSLTLTTSGCGTCNTTTITPNVIWPNILPTGPSPVCVGSTNTYSMPVIPGTFYTWSITGGPGATIVSGGMPYPNNYPVNNPSVNVSFTAAGTYTLTCNYTNPNTIKKCGGSGSITITVKPKYAITGPTNLCQNSPTATYTAPALSTWVITGPAGGWSPGTFPNSNSIGVNWLLPGTYNITAVPVNGTPYCNPSGVSIAVLVKPAPVLTFVTPQLTVCANALTNYSVTSTLPGNVLWSFTLGSGNIYPFGTDNTSASINFTAPGPWTIRAQQTVNGCLGFVTQAINPFPLPTLPATPITACIGGQVTITVASGTGPFTWSTSPNVSLVSPQGGSSATYEIHGNGTITVSNCSGPSNAVTVTASTPPVISISQTGSLCAGNLVLSAPPGVSYQWSGGSNATTQSISVTQPGTYVVQVTFANGCRSVAQITVPPVPLPTVTISTGDPLIWCNPTTPSVTFQAFTLGVGCSYQWYRNNNSNPVGTNSPTYIANIAGTYYVVVTCGGCVATSNSITVIQKICPPPPPGCQGVPNPLSSIIVTGCNPKTFSVTVTGCPGGIVNWNFGDGNTGTGTTVTHTYVNAGVYSVIASITCGPCNFFVQTTTSVPVKASFNSSVVCGINGNKTITMNNTSMVLGGWSVTSVTWNTAPPCPTPSSGTGNTFIINVPPLCNPTVTMTITVMNNITNQVCTATSSFSFNLPTAALTINAPTDVCKNQPVTFTSSMTTGIVQYAWTVNGTPVSQNNPLVYTFSGTPVNNTVGLTVTDAFGCKFTTLRYILVKTPPALTITPSPLVKICPDCPPVTTTLSTSPATGFTGYQWYRNGAAISGATNSTYQVCPGAGIGSYYVTATSASGANGPCPVRSDTVKVVYHPKPNAVITPRNVQCVFTFPHTITNVQSGAAFAANHTYTWYLNNTGTQIFTSSTTNFLTYTINTAGCYVFIVKVTNTVTGCVAYDTACICYSQNPTVNIAPPGPICAGISTTFTATAGPLPPAQYSYVWQDGTTGQNYTTAFAGTYTVTASNIYGCSSSASVMVKPLPYVALFPQGCDTLCLKDSLFFPIPLDNFGNPNYTITWYKGVTVIGTGFSIPLAGLGLGAHTIHAVVVMGGCTATTAKLFLFIKNCTSCDCKESHWGEMTLQSGGATQNLSCDKTYNLKCNQPFTFNAVYNCKDSACTSKVTYSLQPPSGPAITGTMPPAFTYTPTLNGVYTLTLYGWCDTLKCNKCVIKFVVECVDCSCKGSKWGEKTYSIDNVTKSFNCDKNKEVDVKCKVPITINANYNCAKKECESVVTYVLTSPSGTSSGNLPLTFTPNLSGTYTVVLYGYCGGVLCDSCVIKFKTECVETCCPYEIKAETGTVKYDYVQIPNATLASQTFTINGLALANITEVRANVISYTIDDNYKKECMKCVNLPFTWASINSATNIGAAPPKITMYGGTTVPSFNGSGAGAYQNPREVIWNNGSSISIPNNTNIGLNFILPPVPAIDCCELKGKICVKFTFRDKDCKECEVIACFDFVIKKK